MSTVQKEGSKVLIIDEAGESTAGCRWNNVIEESSKFCFYTRFD